MDEITQFRQYKKIIIFAYSPYAGGKFLVNSFGLASKFPLQDFTLATKQINGTLDQVQKYNLLMEKLNQVQNRWNDLNLGDQQLFNSLSFYQSMVTNPLAIKEIPSIVNELIKNNFYIPILTHDYEELNVLQKFFVDPLVIIFINAQFFINFRSRPTLAEFWKKVKTPNWPNTAPKSLAELEQLPETILIEIKNKVGVKKIHNYFQTTTKEEELFKQTVTKKFLYWDCLNYQSVDVCLNEIKRFYDIIGLDDWNPDLISNYFEKWISTLVRLRKYIPW